MANATERTFRFSSDSQAALHAREAVREVAAAVPEDVLADVLLCVTELVTNSVTHAAAGSSEPVELRVRLDGDCLRAEVVDRGGSFVERRKAPRAGDDEQRQRGWGLYIVSVLADRWGVEPGRLTRVWFEKDVSSP